MTVSDASSARRANRRMVLVIAVMVLAWLVVVVFRNTVRAHWWTHRLLKSDEPAARLIHFQRLVALGSTGAAAVEKLLGSDDPAVRGLGVAIVNHTRPARARSLLAGMMDDEDPEVARIAVTGLGMLDDPEVVQDLEQMLKSRDPPRAVLAVTGLGRLRTPEAIDLLVETARRHHLVGARVQSIEELGQLQVERAKDVLIACLDDNSPFEGLTAQEQSASRLLSRAVPGKDAEQPKRSRPVSFFAARALAAIGGEDFTTNGASIPNGR